MIGLVASAVALLILAGLALMMRDVYRQQAKRDAARRAARERYIVTLRFDTYPMVKAFQEIKQVMVKFGRALETNPGLKALVEAEKQRRAGEIRRDDFTLTSGDES